MLYVYTVMYVLCIYSYLCHILHPPACRFVIYATVTNPWLTLPAELLRGAVFALFWAGCTYHVYQAAPTGSTATMVRPLDYCASQLLCDFRVVTYVSYML